MAIALRRKTARAAKITFVRFEEAASVRVEVSGCGVVPLSAIASGSNVL